MSKNMSMNFPPCLPAMMTSEFSEQLLIVIKKNYTSDNKIKGPSKHGEYTTSRDEVEFPKEMTEGWSTMEVCVDCKKFINDIICSSKRSLSTASTRSRIKRKTQSLYMSPSRSRNFRPSERTIKEV